jgi:putative membrane protein
MPEGDIDKILQKFNTKDVNIILRLAVNVFALYVVDYLVPGFSLAGFWTAVVAAVVIGIINTFIKPIVQLIALPVSIITFGIVAFLINVLLLWLAASVVPGFTIDTFLTAVIASLVLSLVSWFLHSLASR